MRGQHRRSRADNYGGTEPGGERENPAQTATKRCALCSGTGYRVSNYGSVRRAVLCECVQGETREKIEEWIKNKAR